MTIFYGGEDDVTRWIANRLAIDCVKNLGLEDDVNIEPLGMRERGTAVLKKLPQIVSLGRKYPIVFVIDSDGACVLDILRTNLPNGWDNSFASVNIAIDEGESWLLADHSGFSKYFGVDISNIQVKDSEVSIPYKTSLYIMKELVPKSNKESVKANMSCTSKGKKPPSYNFLWRKYIFDGWNIQNASLYSNSLTRATSRIIKKCKLYLNDSSTKREVKIHK